MWHREPSYDGSWSSLTFVGRGAMGIAALNPSYDEVVAASFFLAPVDRAAVLDRARFDLDVETLLQQVFQRQHLAGAEQRDAVADIELRRQELADAEHAAAERARVHDAGVVETD